MMYTTFHAFVQSVTMETTITSYFEGQKSVPIKFLHGRRLFSTCQHV